MAVGTTLTTPQYVLLILLILILGILFAFFFKILSTTTSRLGVYHTKESMLERIQKLYSTYMTLIFLLAIFVLVSIAGFPEFFGANLLTIIDDKFDLFIFGLAVASSLLLTIRIYSTTGIVQTNKIEKDMGFNHADLRERNLSMLYSILVSMLIFLNFMLIIIVFKWYQNPTESIDNFMNGSVAVEGSAIKIFVCAITFPLVIATIGELCRDGIAKLLPYPPNNK